MSKNRRIPSYIIKNDLPCLKYVKGISGSFGVSSFLKNYVAVYKSLGWTDDVTLYLRCAERCNILYLSRKLSPNPKDGLLNLSGLDKAQKAELRKFFSSNQYSKDNPPTKQEASEWVNGILAESVAYDGCQEYYKSFNPTLDCCRLCPLSCRYCNQGFFRERTLLRLALADPDSVDCFVSKGISDAMFFSVCDLAGSADPSKDKPVLFQHARFFWNVTTEHLEDLRALSTYAERIDKVSNLSVAQIPERIVGISGGRLPNALPQTIAAVVQNFYGNLAPEDQDAPAVADLFLEQVKPACRNKEVSSMDGVAYPPDPVAPAMNNGSSSVAGPASPVSGSCWRVATAAEVKDFEMRVGDDDLTASPADGNLITVQSVADIPAEAAPAPSPADDSRHDTSGSENMPCGSPQSCTSDALLPVTPTLPDSKNITDVQDADPASASCSTDASPKGLSDDGQSNFDNLPYVCKEKKDIAGSGNSDGYDPLVHERRPFHNSMVCIPFVSEEELKRFCVNLDSAGPRMLTVFMNSLVGGMRPCHAKTKNMLSIELVSLGEGRCVYLMYVPNLGTYFYTGLGNGDVRRILGQAFRYEPLFKYCYMPFLLTAQLRMSGIAAIKNLNSLYTVSSVLYPHHSLSMEDCLKLLGSVPYADRGDGAPSTAALRFMHCYHRTFKIAVTDIASKGHMGIYDRANKYDSSLAYSFLHKTDHDALASLFVMRRAGDYLFPAEVSLDSNGASTWCYSVDPSHCDAPHVIRELLFSLYDERVFRKTGAAVVGMGNFFISLSVPGKNDAALRDRVNLMLTGIAHREGYRYFDYTRTRIAPGAPVAPVSFAPEA